MSRAQLALNVSDLGAAVEFYSTLFATEPAKLRPGYADMKSPATVTPFDLYKPLFALGDHQPARGRGAGAVHVASKPTSRAVELRRRPYQHSGPRRRPSRPPEAGFMASFQRCDDTP